MSAKRPSGKGATPRKDRSQLDDGREVHSDNMATVNAEAVKEAAKLEAETQNDIAAKQVQRDEAMARAQPKMDVDELMMGGVNRAVDAIDRATTLGKIWLLSSAAAEAGQSVDYAALVAQAMGTSALAKAGQSVDFAALLAQEVEKSAAAKARQSFVEAVTTLGKIWLLSRAAAEAGQSVDYDALIRQTMDLKQPDPLH
jgi:hypothetical protein